MFNVIQEILLASWQMLGQMALFLLLGFLIAGPATNAATLTTLWKVLGRRTTVIFLAAIAASAIGFGLLLNALVPVANQVLPQLVAAPYVEGGGVMNNAMAALLLVVLVVSRSLRSKNKG